MDATSVLRVILSVILLVALALNIIFVVFGIRHKIGTRLCSHLLRSQSIIDSLQMLVNLVNFQYFSFFPEPSQTISDSLWLAYCKLAYSEILHWALVCMSVYNLVCLAVERCCCITADKWYARHQRLLAGCFVATVAAAPFIVQVPYCLVVTELVKSADKSLATSNESSSAANATNSSEWKHCEFSADNLNIRMGFGISHITLFWILPTVLSFALYFVILRRFRDARKQHAESHVNKMLMSRATIRLTVLTCVTSGAFVLLFAMDSITYLLYCVGVPMEKKGALDSVDSFLLCLNSAVNPLFYLIFIPEYRSFVACAHLRATKQPPQCCDDGQTMGLSDSAVTASSVGGGVASPS